MQYRQPTSIWIVQISPVKYENAKDKNIFVNFEIHVDKVVLNMSLFKNTRNIIIIGTETQGFLFIGAI